MANAKTIAVDGSQARADAGSVPSSAPSSGRSAIGAGILIGAEIALGAYNAYQSKKAYDLQKEYNEQQVELSNTAISRAVRDAQSVGLSPLAVTGGAQGAVSPDLSAGRAPAASLDAFSKMASLAQLGFQSRLTDAQVGQLNSSSAKMQAETNSKLIEQQTQLEGQKNQLEIQRASLEKLIQEGKVEKAEAEKRAARLQATIDSVNLQTEQLRKQLEFNQFAGVAPGATWSLSSSSPNPFAFGLYNMRGNQDSVANTPAFSAKTESANQPNEQQQEILNQIDRLEAEFSALRSTVNDSSKPIKDRRLAENEAKATRDLINRLNKQLPRKFRR